MKVKGLMVTLLSLGWFILIVSAFMVIVGLFFVMGTAQPWGLIIPVLFLSLGWLLTHLDFEDRYWKITMGEIIIIWGIGGLLTSLLIISRTSSVIVAIIWIPLSFCLGLIGVILRISGTRTGTKSSPSLPPLPKAHN